MRYRQDIGGVDGVTCQTAVAVTVYGVCMYMNI